jgi:hypothetical protein
MMKLSPLEEDILGDLDQDDHSLYEFFEFVRLHHPDLDAARVFETGRTLVAEWLERGWLELSTDQTTWGDAASIEDLLAILDRHGESATRYFKGSPELRLAEAAFSDVDWLKR